MPEDSAPHEGQILRGFLFSEPMRVEAVRVGGFTLSFHPPVSPILQ
jgi:hypothetical protein